MGLSIKNDETEQLVRKLAKQRGIGVTSAIKLAVNNQLLRDRFAPTDDWSRRLADIDAIQRRSSALPVLDHRTDDEILGYDSTGLPDC